MVDGEPGDGSRGRPSVAGEFAVSSEIGAGGSRRAVRADDEGCSYRTGPPFVLVDRSTEWVGSFLAVKLTTKVVAENCLALTADAFNHRNSPDNDGETPTIIQTRLADLNVKESSHTGRIVHRRDSYQQAIANAETINFEADLDHTELTIIDESEHSVQLDTVSEVDEPDVNGDPLKELNLATSVKEDSPVTSADEMPECEKEVDRTDLSSTRADILDSVSEELDVVAATQQAPFVCQTETSRSLSESVEDESTVNDLRYPEDSHSPNVSVSCELEESRVPDRVSPSLSELKTEEVVWISQTTSDVQPPDHTADEPMEEPDAGVKGQDTSVSVPPASDQFEDVLKATSSSRPPPPIDVIAIDMTGRRVSGAHPRDDDRDEEQNNLDGDYCHSPLGGAMPESEDSSVGEFVFP